ncbi:MAG: carboxypeptidase-like regulatory domain-containing protein, partial [Saprospiraceae bacterium]|nr:carboxypeptidase-like regulatory domain-containing protein [Saprospiraceae bacterium]
EGGSASIEQLSRNNSIAPWVNTLYTLALQENYLKIYQKQYFDVGYRQELRNGILLSTSIEYARRNPLENLEDPFRITYFRDQPYTSNTPLRAQGALLESETFTPHNALVWSAGLRFRFRQRYLNYPDRKYLDDSKYPTLYLRYRKGLPWAGSEVDYDLLIVSADQSYRLGRLGAGQWEVEGGWFWRQERLFFPDYRHFLGNQTIFRRLNFGLGDYQLLDYYTFSTNRYYLKGHWEHQLNGLFS